MNTRNGFGQGRRTSLLPRSSKSGRGRQIGLALASTIGWILSLAAFQGFIDIRTLLQSDDDWFRDGLIFINHDVRLTDSIGVTSTNVSPKSLAKIRAVPGVSIAEPILRNHFPAAVQMGGGPIPAISSEVFLEAIPPELLSTGHEDWSWNPGDEIVPILIPRQFLNLYNFGFAPGKGLPPVSESTAKKVRFRLITYPYNGDAPVFYTASISGFSDEIESLLVPVSFLTYANAEYGDTATTGVGRVAVLLNDPDSKAFHKLLEDERLRAGKGTRENARLRILLDLCLAVLGTAGGIILFLNLLLFLTEAESLLADHRDRIRKLFFLGHNPTTLLRRLVGLRILAAVIPAIVGLVVLWWIRHPVATFLDESGIAIDPNPSPITVLAWFVLLLLANAWLLGRIRNRLLRLYR